MMVQKDGGGRMDCIVSITPTICELMGIARPALSTDRVLEEVVRDVREGKGIERVSRCLVFAPDAIGSALFRDFKHEFSPVLEHAPQSVSLRSVVPPKTPVCFASMFTGAMPESHGIRRPERPVLKCDTIFDALARAGKKAAIIAVKGSSIDLIFRQRKVDYYSEPYDTEVMDRVMDVLATGEHDFILAYNQEYDDAMHEHGPRSPEALNAMRAHVRTFDRLAMGVERHWKGHDRMMLFTPDHGAHEATGPRKGDHGSDIPEDMEVTHFFGARKASR